VASGEQIQADLRRFVAKWGPYTGSERSEAQTFLNELFACYGTDRLAVGARFEDFKSSAGFMDLHWPGICIIEMKAPNRDVSVAREQVRRYWGSPPILSSTSRPLGWLSEAPGGDNRSTYKGGGPDGGIRPAWRGKDLVRRAR